MMQYSSGKQSSRVTQSRWGNYRPQYLPLINPVNPVLKWLRAVWDDEKCGTHAQILDYMLHDHRMIEDDAYPADQIAHARRVLQRLEALQPEKS